MEKGIFLSKVNKIIEAELYNDQLNGEYLANYLGMSRMHLYRLLKEYTGFAASEYILKLRIEKAKNILLETNIPICSIATTIGIKYPAYFTRIFKNNTGLTPREYRKAYQ